jgi:hypothetical protein
MSMIAFDGLLNVADFEGLSVDGIGHDELPPALLLDSSIDPSSIDDITFAIAGQWAATEITAVDLADETAIRERMEKSARLLEDLTACARWPIAAHAHMQVVHQLSGFLMSELVRGEDEDMSIDHAMEWAAEEVLKVDLRDPWAIADRLAEVADKLSCSEACRQHPGSAFGYRVLMSELSVMLARTGRKLH